MKPLKLELQAFGPFADYQCVDFKKLSQKGMFLIKGNTGSGKTTIFDAMTFALYGGGSGEDSKSRNGRNDLEQWRCTQADSRTATFVALTFSVRGRQYYFKRGLEPKRVNLSASFEAGEIDANGVVIPFFSNPKKDTLTKKAEELIGLTKEQFRQVVLLPQGQFERFLTASSGEKESILQKIFGAEQWEKYVQAFYAEAIGRKSRLDMQAMEVRTALAEEQAESVEALSAMIEAMKAEREHIGQAHNAFHGAEKQAQLERDRALSARYKDLRALSLKIQRQNSMRGEMDALRIKYAKAEKAEALRDYIAGFEAAQAQMMGRRRVLETLLAGLPAAINAQNEAKRKKDDHERSSPIEALTKTIGEYSNKAQAYRDFDGLKTVRAAALEKFGNAKISADDARNGHQAALEAAKEGKMAFDAADQAARDTRERYFRGIYGELADRLVDGERCPVCGSKAHPSPAKKAADSISKEEMQAAQDRADTERTRWDNSETARKDAEQLLKQAEEVLKEAGIENSRAEAQLKAAEQNLIEGIADEAALKKRIQALEDEIFQFKLESEALQAALEQATKSVTELRESIRLAGEEAQKAETVFLDAKTALDRALTENGYADLSKPKEDMLASDLRLQLHARIITYDADCRSSQEEYSRKSMELQGQTEPDESAFQARAQAIQSEEKEFNRRDAELQANINRLSDKLQLLKEKWNHYRQNIRLAESDLAFARKLRGDTGIGLQRYVLAIMFNQVIGEANRMLENVHGGRYRLFRSDDKVTGNKRGLELKVHDSRSPELDGRSVTMLSGGEKFLVSLALSIGMSTVAQKAGVQIEALFIDEGFGTLDNSSIKDAMDILERVRTASGTIGIISHVQLLEANIPTHLEVVKQDCGSKIVLC